MNPFVSVADLCRRHADIPRPLLVATVADVSGWSSVGPATILVDVAGERKNALYRDGRAPVVGEAVEIIRMGPDAGSPWLALPLPATVAPICDLYTMFIVNGAPVGPTLPQDGSLGGSRVRAQTDTSAGCAHIRLALRSYRTDPATGNVISLYQESLFGPFDGAQTQYVEVVVPGPAQGANAYYVQSIVSGATIPPPLAPGSHP